MRTLVHACPKRMWYVEEILVPMLREQGADEIRIWNDVEGRGNLISCMESFRSLSGDGGPWHLQDDVLPCRDFVTRCRQHDEGVVYGFCCEQFLDDPHQTGRVYMEDAWHSFQCVRIPDKYARGCAEWFFSGAWEDWHEPELDVLQAVGAGDDTFFRNYLLCRHGTETAVNLTPNLVEHVDLLIGGSVVNEWRSCWARAHYWDDWELVDELAAALEKRQRRTC